MKNIFKTLSKPFPLKDQILFARRLSLLIDAGISLAEALRILRDIEISKRRRRAYERLLMNVEQGVSLSESFKVSAISLEDTLVALIETGESSGSLGACLTQAHAYLEKKNDLNKKVAGSLIYPGFIVFATIGMTLFLVLFIFPKIIPLLKSLNIELPLITRAVLELYHFLLLYGLWSILAAVTLLILCTILIKKSKIIRYLLHSLLLRLPVIGKFMQIYSISRVLSIGYILLSSGISLHATLRFSQKSSKNLLYKIAYGKVAEECNRGVTLAAAMSVHKNLFPLLLVHMVLIGERTGNLASLMHHSGKIYEQEIETTLKKFSSLIEPLLMILMGLVVGSIALSIILPVYEVTNHLNQ